MQQSALLIDQLVWIIFTRLKREREREREREDPVISHSLLRMIFGSRTQ
ncbi:unnamed protein product [Musa acuminata subsp. burmannicoides]